MGVVEPQQAAPLRIVEGQAVGQAVRLFSSRRDALHLDLDPAALLEKVSGAIEIQQVGELMLGWRLHHILSCGDRNGRRAVMQADIPS